MQDSNRLERYVKGLLERYFRFVVIAGFATLIHICVLWGGVSLLSVPPLLGNVVAFLVAFSFNYFAQKRVTFSVSEGHSVAVAFGLLLNFVLNQACYALALKFFSWHYLFSLVVTLAVTSPLSFMIVYSRTKRAL